MNKFRYFSDLHGYNPDFKRDTDADEYCILAGDLTEFGKKGVRLIELLMELCDRFKAVIYVPGNHEYYGTHINTFERKTLEAMKEVDNFHLLQCDSIVIDDVLIVGATMWSDTRDILYDARTMMNDYKYIRIGPWSTPWKNKLDPLDTTRMHMDHVHYINEELKKWDGDSIVITHHAPSMLSIDPRYEGNSLNPAYATDIVLDKWPNYWIHGHIHRATSYILNGCNVLCNPGGYQSEYTDFEPLFNYFRL